jgi:HPt (histidine-containing phosphotransfer) domain-containing protein
VGLRQLVDQLRRDIEAGIEKLDAAFASGDLTAIAQAAHTARNDALMLDATELLRTLEGLESAAREGERASVSTELRQLHAVWPGLRDQLLRAAHRPSP